MSKEEITEKKIWLLSVPYVMIKSIAEKIECSEL